MTETTKGSTFAAEPEQVDINEARERAYLRVPSMQLTAALVFFAIASQMRMEEGVWGKALWVASIGLLYWFIRGIFGRFTAYKASQRHALLNHQRMMTNFICEALLGRVPRQNMERLAAATTGVAHAQDIDGMPDDFSLISRAYRFWDAGFEWQSDTVCVNCARARSDHGQDGGCPKNHETH